MKEEKDQVNSYIRDIIFSGVVIILLIVIVIMMAILNAVKKYDIEQSVQSAATATSYQLIESTTSSEDPKQSETSEIIITSNLVSSVTTESEETELSSTESKETKQSSTETSATVTTTHTTKDTTKGTTKKTVVSESEKETHREKKRSSQTERTSSSSSSVTSETSVTSEPSKKEKETKGTDGTSGNSDNGGEKSDRFDRAEAKKLLGLVNEYRVSCGVAELKWSDSLAKAARTRAKETSSATKSQNKNHTRPNGKEWYTVNPDIMYGENLAFGQKSAKEVFEAYKNSTAHRETMLDPEYKTFGAGFYIKDKTTYKYYWVQEFGY